MSTHHHHNYTHTTHLVFHKSVFSMCVIVCNIKHNHPNTPITHMIFTETPHRNAITKTQTNRKTTNYAPSEYVAPVYRAISTRNATALWWLRSQWPASLRWLRRIQTATTATSASAGECVRCVRALANRIRMMPPIRFEVCRTRYTIFIIFTYLLIAYDFVSVLHCWCFFGWFCAEHALFV